MPSGHASGKVGVAGDTLSDQSCPRVSERPLARKKHLFRPAPGRRNPEQINSGRARPRPLRQFLSRALALSNQRPEHPGL